MIGGNGGGDVVSVLVMVFVILVGAALMLFIPVVKKRSQ